MSDPRFLTGQYLLSMPGIGDERFNRTVIAMCVHDDDGALGMIVNRPHASMTVRELMAQLDIDPGVTPLDARVMSGGPVEPGRGFVVHSPDYSGQGTIHVGSLGGIRWGLTSTVDVLRDIAVGRGPKRWLAALGYTGWSAGQLDNELSRHGWHSIEGSDDLMFDTAVDRRWPRAFASLGIDVGHLSAASGTA
ncbi:MULTISPECIES: YqgE/AlgH family protein [Sphingosinicellaceae]|uniref:YqgE/AlgH family protein n=1 Tax=Sphingosinicellaceae TaxID=2820280 RepID=UPI001C1DE40E|nr:MULTISPECIES: YqgE/AlgH family protein [Polymorphobacter]QYE36131.1 YqgE/AlgH family protein [Polymorphobacter sp. PAMC 29334]UAJ10298.1 YqgE/AlgH family protein [Polymorphobacter megasporae]